MSNKLRLKFDDIWERTEENNQEEPLRIVFLSVEGNDTEIRYFKYVHKYRSEIGIKKGVHIYPLKRFKKDTLSAPKDVLDLLEEYIEFRESKNLPKRLKDAIDNKEYSYEFIERYLEEKVTEKDKIDRFELLLKRVGFDLAYKKFLDEYRSDNDVFGIVIDRDYKTHSVQQMKEVVQECSEKNYRCFISTPLFEFWLLLHLTDVSSKSAEELDKILVNDRVSNRHTYTSELVSKMVHHSKKINEKIFKEVYLPKTDYAMEQAKKNYAHSIDDLIGNEDPEDEKAKMGKIGTNIPELFDLLREV